MHTIRLSLAGGSLLLLSACSNPFQRDGGPCKYDSHIVEAKVIAIHDNIVEFEGEIENFNIRKGAFETLPEVGDQVTLKKATITKGTCTPVNYSVVKDTGTD